MTQATISMQVKFLSALPDELFQLRAMTPTCISIEYLIEGTEEIDRDFVTNQCIKFKNQAGLNNCALIIHWKP